MLRKITKSIFLVLTILAGYSSMAQKQVSVINIDCFGEKMTYQFSQPVIIDTGHPTTEAEIETYCKNISGQPLHDLVLKLHQFSEKNHLDHWLYYQLIRRVADQLAPKSEDYTLYTLYKWYLLSVSGFDAILTFSEGKILFYVNSAENIYNIPIRKEDNRTYVCLNYHDYGKIDFKASQFHKLNVHVPGAVNAFSYKVNSIPEPNKTYIEKDLNFTFNNTEYHFRIKLNPTISTYFKNYPTTDYEKHFNIPLSSETYNSLIPSLKKYIKGLSPKDGVDFLLHFTRYSFLFKPDTEKYGMEKVNSPEMTLINESSDCEDRVSLFYYLVREIYDLPMIVMVYPKHVSVAVQFEKNIGQTVEFRGQRFTVCEPTPQQKDLKLGESIPALVNTPYQVAFAYQPKRNKQ